VTIHRICGPVVQTGPDTWSIRFYRMGMNNTKRSNEICFFASHPGDAEYKRAVQQASLRFPLRNTTGKDQRITFPEIQSDRNFAPRPTPACRFTITSAKARPRSKATG